MGEAARKARIVSVLVPERGRPEALERLIVSLIDTAGGDDGYEIIVGIDEGDPAWRDRTPFEHVRTRYLRRERAPTLGEKLNDLAREAQGGVLAFLANDVVMETRDWPARYREAAASLPNGVGILYPRDPNHPDHASFPAMTRAMYTGMGIFAAPWFPHWFGADSWHDELGIMIGIKVEVPVSVGMPDGNLRSERKDLAFWADVFERTRPMRARDAAMLIENAYGRATERSRAETAQLFNRVAVCEQRMAHTRSPAFLARWDDGEGPATEAKEIAAQLVKDIERQMPRQVRVAICVPSGISWMACTANSVAAAAAYSTAAGINCSFLNVQSSQITHSRNKTVELALEQNMDYIWFVDSDMVFPPDTLLKLLRHEKDIVGATYSKRVPPWETLGRLKGPKPPDSELRGGLHEAELMPSGMMLIKAEVFRKLGKPWYAECYQWPGAGKLASFKEMMRNYYAFTPSDEVLDTLDNSEFGMWIAQYGTQSKEIGENFENFGEDNFFCRRARKAGYQVWCCLDTTFTMIHLGVHEVTCKLPDELKLAAD